MPLTHLSFDRGKVELPLQEALDKAAKGELEKYGWTYELLKSVLEVQEDRGERISTTTLTAKCDRSEYLKRKTDYTEDPLKLWPAFRGTLFHGQLEWNAHPANIAEARYYVRMDDGRDVTGSPDLVSPYLGRLSDYKTNKENPRYGKPWPEHILQVQINRWLVDHAYMVEYQGETFRLSYEKVGDITPTEEAVRANRAKFVPAKWDSLWLVYMDDKGPDPICVTKSEKVIGKNGREKTVRVPDIWGDERVGDLVKVLYRERRASYSGDKLPKIPEAFHLWEHPLCAWCPVRKLCKELELQGA